MSISDLSQATAIHHIPQYHAAAHPNRLCVIDTANRSISYGMLWEKITQASQYLKQQGVQPGDRILVVGENCVDMMTLYFACRDRKSTRLNSRHVATSYAVFCLKSKTCSGLRYSGRPAERCTYERKVSAQTWVRIVTGTGTAR